VSVLAPAEAPCAIALAGGQGVRARPLTLVAPDYLRSKAAMRVAGRTLIEWAVDSLSSQGVRQVYVLANGRENRTQTMEILGDGCGHGVEVRYSRARFDAWNTGSGEATLRCLEYWDVTGTAVVFPTDSIFDFDLEAMTRRHEESDAVVTVATVPREPHVAARKYGVLAEDSAGMVRRFLEKPSLDEVRRLSGGGPVSTNAGIYLVDGKRLREAGRESGLAQLARSRLDWGGDLLPYLVRQGHRVGAHPIGRFGDLGSPRDYLETVLALLRGDYPALSGRIAPPAAAPHGPRVDVSSLNLRDSVTGLTLAEKLDRGLVRIGPNVRVGRDVELAPGVVLEDCDIADGVDVGEGSELRAVACADHAIVGSWARITDSVLGASAVVGSNRQRPTVLEDCCVLGDESTVPPGTRLRGVELFPRLTVRAGVGVPPGSRLDEPGALARWN
jgi:NDP-sugar pyrophosphorylase family protein